MIRVSDSRWDYDLRFCRKRFQRSHRDGGDVLRLVDNARPTVRPIRQGITLSNQGSVKFADASRRPRGIDQP